MSNLRPSQLIDLLFAAEQTMVNPILSNLLRSSYSEMPVLLAVYFHTNQINQVEEIVEKTMGMNVNVQKLGLYRMQKLFTQVFSLLSCDVAASPLVFIPKVPHRDRVHPIS